MVSADSINLNHMELKKVLKIMMATSDTASFAEIARKLDYKETTFRSAVSNNTIRLSDFLTAAELMGYTITAQKSK